MDTLQENQRLKDEIERLRKLLELKQSFGQSNEKYNTEKLIEDLQKSMDNFYELFNLTQEALVISDENFFITDMNIAAKKMFGAIDDNFIGKNLINYVPTYELAQVQEALKKQDVSPYELSLYKNDKTLFPVLAAGHNIIRNGIKQRLTTIVDMTELKEKEKQLLASEKHRALFDMIENIAHQWRQPLSAVSTIATGMSFQKEFGILTDEQFYQGCNDINTQIQRLSLMIEKFKNFINTDKDSTPMNIKESIETFLSLVDDESTNIKIITDDIDNIEIINFSNVFIQILLHIFNNSKEAFLVNQIENRYILLNSKKDNDKIIFTFSDSAGGIDENLLPKVFEPFFTTKHQYTDTGLGLSTVYILVTNTLKGEIQIKNKEFVYDNISHKGVEVTITFPLS